MEKDRNTPRWRNTIPGFVWAIVIVFTLILAGGITYSIRQARDHATRPTQQLVTITFDASFIRHIKLTPKQFAHLTQNVMGTKTKKSYTNKNGEVIVKITPSDQRRIIRGYKKQISTFSTLFLSSNPKYKFKVSNQYRTIDIWLDNTIGPEKYSAITLFVPEYYGFLYYFKGNTGPWDMTTTIYNCNTGKRLIRFSHWDVPKFPWPPTFFK